MDERLNEKLKDALDGLSARDAAPGFDKLRTWKAIESRLPPVTRSPAFLQRRPVRVAAGIAALLVAGLALKFGSLHRADRFNGLIAHQFDQPATAPAAPAANAPASRVAMLPAPPPYQAPRPARIRRGAAPQARLIVSAGSTEPAALKAEAQQVIPPASPAQRQAPRRAVHILDIDAAARTVLLNEPAPVPGKPGILEYVMVRTMPEPAAQSAPASIFRRY